MDKVNVIVNPIGDIPVAKNSHVLGWSQTWANQLNAIIDHKCSSNILNADVVYIDHGVNYSGSLNLFGGASKKLFDNLSLIMECKNVISLDCDMPDLGKQLSNRIGQNSTDKNFTQSWCDKLSNKCLEIKKLSQKDLDLDSITVGDSHSIAFSNKSDIVLRENGRTLFGSIKKGLITNLDGISLKNKSVNFCYGSIDIRHHVLRHSAFDIEDLLCSYIKQIRDIEAANHCGISVSVPVPVESENRKIPKSGFYKGTPFFGSREDRLELTLKTIDFLNKHFKPEEIVSPPDVWYKMDPEQYAKTYMERGSSVHISPQFYRRNNWGKLYNINKHLKI